MWVRVSKSVYRNLEIKESGRFEMDKESKWSSWWKDVIENVVGVSGRWLWGTLERCVGNERDINFWGSMCRCKAPKMTDKLNKYQKPK